MKHRLSVLFVLAPDRRCTGVRPQTGARLQMAQAQAPEQEASRGTADEDHRGQPRSSEQSPRARPGAFLGTSAGVTVGLLSLVHVAEVGLVAGGVGAAGWWLWPSHVPPPAPAQTNGRSSDSSRPNALNSGLGVRVCFMWDLSSASKPSAEQSGG